MSQRSGKLQGKRALITGASRGLGSTVAEFFAQEGADLVLAARSASSLETTAAVCRELGAEVVAQPLDLADQEALEQFTRRIQADRLVIDVLVNNAAILPKGLMHELPIADFQRALAVNLIAPFILSRWCIARLRAANRGGVIVNISSLSGCFGVPKFPGFGAYNISKFGIWGLSEILALENNDFGIRVNQLSLSAVDTQMFREASPPGLEPYLSREEAAKFVLFLASPDSEPLSGENIILTGSPPKR